MRRFTVWTLAMMILLTCAGTALTAKQPPPGRGPTDPTELESFLDPIFARHMQERNIPGAVFVLVKDGRIFFTKGYGLANVEQRTPVVPDRTIFAIGSVTKLFTATAVMQLAEQGKLDLHADVNRYLKELQVPATYPEPVTTAHLLTHTAGFDQPAKWFVVGTQSELDPLGEFVAWAMPSRIRPPGQKWAYSNYSYVLAGYLVETLSGRSYEQYITDEILMPLGMTHSAFGRPAEMAADMAPVNGYVGNPPRQQSPFFSQGAPAGDLKATATDMAAFMIAHLQNGQYEGIRILGEETAREMHSVQVPVPPGVTDAPEMGYGFWEGVLDGRRVIQHGGDVGSSSLLVLVPGENWGFFVAYNSPYGANVRDDLEVAILNQYPPAAPPASPDAFKEAAARYSGSYRLIRSDQNSIAKVQGILATIAVTDNGDGSLTLRPSKGLALPARLQPVEPLLFRAADGETMVHFQADARGRITRLSVPFAVFGAQHLAWYESTALHLALIAGAGLLALSAVVLWPIGALIRRRRDRPCLPAPVRAARWVGEAVSGLYLTFLVGFGLFLASVAQSAVFSVPLWTKLLMALPLLMVVLTVPLVWMAVRVWRSPGCSLGGKLHLALLTIAFVSLIPCLQYWNLLGFRFPQN